jgi:hypothetical protein
MTPAIRAVLFSQRRMAPYLGQVASHSFMPTSFSATNKQIMSRTRHVCRENVSQVQLIFPNWYANNSAPGADATITASIEYPVGTFTQVTFSASASGTIPNGSTLTSDPVNLAIAKGDAFYSRSYFTSTAGIIYHGQVNTLSLGERVAFGVSGIVDMTMGGTVPAGSDIGYAPLAIIGQTRVPSFALLGDSKVAGVGDTVSTTTSAVGELARSFGNDFAYINLGFTGTTAAQIVAQGASGPRVLAGLYCSHVICELGVNDLPRGAAPILADLQTIRGFFPGRPFVQSTITPKTTGAWTLADGSDQTVTAQESSRVSLNASIRAIPSGFAGFLEIADQVESARDSGKWKAPGYTADGLHETPTGYLAIQNSGAINPTLLGRLR